MQKMNVNKSILIDATPEKKSLLAQGGALMANILDTQLEESETNDELNFAVLKLKHIRKCKR